MRIQTMSIFVDDQERAHAFYTEVLGFEISADVPVGEHRWLTVRAPGGAGPDLLLEPKGHPAVIPFTAALHADGIPFCQLGVDDLDAEHARLTAQGVHFTVMPMDAGPVRVAVFDDTCGNLLQLVQPLA